MSEAFPGDRYLHNQTLRFNDTNTVHDDALHFTAGHSSALYLGECGRSDRTESADSKKSNPESAHYCLLTIARRSHEASHTISASGPRRGNSTDGIPDAIRHRRAMT
ncbi:MAG: hypothetical protein ACREUT_13575 [Steroidobacteraceae bacterium]